MEQFKMGLSLKYKLLLILVSLPLISLSLYLAMATDLFQTDKVAYVYDSSATVSRGLATEVRMEAQNAYANLRAIVEQFDYAAADFSPAAKELFNRNSRVDALVLFRREADGLFKKIGQMAKSGADSQAFLTNDALLTLARDQAVENMAFLSENDRARDAVTVAYRLGEKAQPNQLVVVGLNKAEDLLGEFQAAGMYSSIVVTRSGRVAIGANDAINADLGILKGILQADTKDGTAETRFSDGITYLVSFADVGMGDLAVVSKVDKKKALKAVQILVAKSMLFFVALIASTLLISVIASSRLTSTLRDLFEATKKIAQGDFTVRVQAQSNDEVGGLATSFNWMAGEVKRLMSETAEKARMESELSTVRTVQETLFPPAQAQFGSLHISGHFEPASECGGDWWSYSEIDGKIYLYVGDATGHGAPAALITSAARSAAAVIESLPDINPAKALSILNRAIALTSKGQINMTFFLACVDPKDMTFTYANASHDPPYLLRWTGEKLGKKDLLPLNEVNGTRLGEQKDFQYDQITLQLGPGDQVLFYTDGVLDIENAEGKKWGERAFLKSMIDSANSGANLNDRMTMIRNEAQTFRGKCNLVDDVTIVMCEFEKKAS